MNLNGATVVVDLDGTLVNTAPDLVGALNTVLETEGLPTLPLAAAGHMVGQGAEALLRRGFAAAGATWSDPRAEALTAHFIAVYLERIARESRPYPGVEDALDALESAGARLALCTNKRTDLTLALLQAVGLSSRFEAILGGDWGGPMKPDGAPILETIARAGGDPARAVMVGDSDNDVLAAAAAGIPSVVFTFGYCATPAAELGAILVLDAWADLPDAIASLAGAGSPAYIAASPASAPRADA